MDNTTRFIDTLNAITAEMTELQKRLTKLSSNVVMVCQTLTKGDVKDRDTRTAKLSAAKNITEELQNFICFAASQRILQLYGALETFHTILDEKENETWVVRATRKTLTAPQTVDHLTDAITEYLSQHQTDKISPKAAFADNPDNFVSDFVRSYLDHPITDRMSDMVISLVTDWLTLG